MRTSVVLVLLALFAESAVCQFSGNVVVPQSRVVGTTSAASPLRVVQVSAEIDLVTRVAVTALTFDLRNDSAVAQEAELLLPVPDDAIVRHFDFEGAATEPTTQLLPRGAAKATYQSLVHRVQDPALLEFAGRASVRSSVFPVPAHGTQRVRLIYEHLGRVDGDRIDYELPRSEFLGSAIPWRVSARIRAQKPIATIYSPTHAFTQRRVTPSEIRLDLPLACANDPGAIEFSVLLEGDGVNGSFYAYPDATGDGGYFVLLGGLSVTRDPAKERGRKREVVVVLDTSGSMAGAKLAQAKLAALQVLDGLDDGERFAILDYDDTVSCFTDAPVAKDGSTMSRAREYINKLEARGATNIHGALLRALSCDHDAATIPIVLFLTDGLPTIGVTDELELRKAAADGNEHSRRIFTFGVGDDVNAPLLDHIANTSRGTTTYVRPSESVEKKVSEVFARLKGPVLASPRLAVFDAAGQPASHRVTEVMPSVLPDLFDGDELVITGRYRGNEPVILEIAGDYLGSERSFHQRLVPATATSPFTFVPRLWAARRIGELTDQLRQAGAIASEVATYGAANPGEKELLDEVYRLSREYGIMTEATAFLALEGTNLDADALNLNQLGSNVRKRLQNIRSGAVAISQSVSTRARATQRRVDPRNRLASGTSQPTGVDTVAQIGDRAFYRRGQRWIDSRLPRALDGAPPDEVIAFGSPRYASLLARLLVRGRQGAFALRGDVLIEIDGKRVLMLGPTPPVPPKSP